MQALTTHCKTDRCTKVHSSDLSLLMARISVLGKSKQQLLGTSSGAASAAVLPEGAADLFYECV